MSWHCSQALVAEFSEVICLAGDVSVLSSTTPTPAAFYWPDKTTEHSRLSRFGMTSELLMESRGEELLMWYLAGFRAKTLAQPEGATDSTASAADCGERWQGSLARYDRATHSLKTAQCSLLEDSIESCAILPRWGSMRNGALYLRPIPALPICENASGLWQTPVADDAIERKAGNWNSRGEPKLSAQVLMMPTPCARDYRGIGRSRLERTGSKAGECLPQFVGGLLNPAWTEWLMGWPIGWTELKPLETAKFQEWQQQHSLNLLGEPEHSSKEAA